MFSDVMETLEEVLFLWEQMQSSHADDAGDDADRFQMMFYVFVEHVRAWVETMDDAPKDVDEARAQLEFAQLFELLPDPLQIPFETELEAILTNGQRHVDSTEQG
ncbi:MAG: hypothetical protein A2201_07785 [Alicyclobacillus sp. RIFOXYA1_FULL_53_8]|nr:MAG: hypothetical protein A2201_07785 [Alicyclobacillus sp. RIFOXYA1_FULL_53_8]